MSVFLQQEKRTKWEKRHHFVTICFVTFDRFTIIHRFIVTRPGARLENIFFKI